MLFSGSAIDMLAEPLAILVTMNDEDLQHSNDYELQRLRRIQQNKERLQQLGVSMEAAVC
jgi:hypothetical protein